MGSFPAASLRGFVAEVWFAFRVANQYDGEMSRPAWISLLVLVLVLGGLGFWLTQRPAQVTSAPEPKPVVQVVDSTPELPAPHPLPTTQTNMAVPTPVQPSPTSLVAPEMRALIQQLTAVDFASAALNPEQAALWKTNLHQLIQAGTNAIPAIREFLQQNKDARFDPKLGKNLLGYPSLRVALLDALQQIGGPAALQLAVETLHTASQPHEIGQLARHLEADAPGQHRDAVLSAARESLAMASSGKLTGVDVGPLFDLMSRYGGAGAVNDLQQGAKPYRYYAAVALANVPDGVGIPALIGMLREPEGPNKSTHVPALEALAQLAAQYPEAGARLIDEANRKQIPDTLWPSIAESLAGARSMIGNLAEWGLTPQSGDKTLHLAAGNQNILKRRNPGELNPEQRQQRITYIDQLLALNPGPIAVEHLQKAKTTLAK
jgi:hypothetical protein